MAAPKKKVPISKTNKKLYVGSIDNAYIWGMEPSSDIGHVCDLIREESGENIDCVTIYELNLIGTYEKGGWTKK